MSRRVRVAVELLACAVLAAWALTLLMREVARRPGSGDDGWSW